MSLSDLLQTLSKIAQDNNIHTPYIVGGIPRDVVLGKLEDVNDIDITTGFPDVDQLADKFAEAVDASAQKMKDGHKQVIVGGFKFDFSSNTIYKGIDDALNKMGVDNIDNLKRETYSRDFTINTLMLPLDFSKVIDLTGKGVIDLEAGRLRCPVECDVAFVNSPMRILRAFYYAAKYGFRMGDEMRDSIKKNAGLLQSASKHYVSEKMHDIVRMKPELINDLIELGVIHQVPLTGTLGRALIRQKRLLDVL